MDKFIPVCEPLLAGNELKYVTDAVKTGWISSAGRYVTEFENKFAEYCGCRYGVAVCNGTIALHLALVALGVEKGDEVIIPNFTMIATAFAVCYTGATPVFVDADSENWNIDVSKIEEKITPKTKVILPVHLFGRMCDMDAINSLARKYNLKVLEDAAESHGAEYKGRKAGSCSDLAAFSFFANKNITTGEGGMIVTNDETLYNRLRYFKNVCFPLNGPRNYIHDDIGFNYRMSNVVAAIGLAQVERADDYKQMRIQNNALYRQYLKDVPGIIFQPLDKDYLNVSWMNTIVVKPSDYGHTKDELCAFLKQNNVDSRLLFVGMHRQPSMKKYGCDCSGIYPVSDSLTSNGFYLPSASSLSEDDIKGICQLIVDFHKK
ncbi:MAG: DegT/DnrJ/EryC1/StrS family aminotransferase [Paludibacteraceae bacterium]|nr:DegT/DnrJ/EryC1/StrS family aminotransferase [Paludibacteraceae bacterium]